MSTETPVRTIHGKAISPGLAGGRTFVHHSGFNALDVPGGIESKDIEKQFGHLDRATASISQGLLSLATKVEKEMNSRLAAVFEAHQLMLNDPLLKRELQVEIRENLVSASSAVKAVFLRWEKRFMLMESQVARHKGDDMRDLSNRLSNELSGIKLHALENIPPGSVLVATRLLPSDTVFLSQHAAAAVLLEYGGAGSHAALFAREMGLPCIAAIPRILEEIPAGAFALVDAYNGTATINPRPEDKADFHNKVLAQQKSFSRARQRAREHAQTRDGVQVQVLANVGSRADAEKAMELGAEGIGLYRTEHAYLGRATPPDVDELVEEMRDTLTPAKGRPVCIRLLDIGADKLLPFTGFLAESNPALGRRGIRYLRAFPHLLETQLQAVLQLSKEFDIRLLVPMVTLPADMAAVKETLEHLQAEGDFDARLAVGAMIETPAAALSARELAPYADFFSFGTNDLTQYCFACDRDNAAVEHYTADNADVVFRLLKIVHADVPAMPLSICGELAGYPGHVAELLACGIRTLSLAAPLIPTIKEAIRSVERVATPHA
jgi:phosphoenolpyruvate-protein phosphotransferase